MAVPPTRRVAELRGPQVGALRSDSLLVLPVGSVEHHGPHLPLATDLVVAEAVAEALVERHGDELDLWLLPSLAYASSEAHAGAPGTAQLSATTLLAVLDDLGRSLARLPTPDAPGPTLVLLAGHPGGAPLLEVACRELRRRHGLATFLALAGDPSDEDDGSAPGEHGMGVHGGHDETSLLLHLRPDLVDLSAARRNVPAAIIEHRHVRFGGPVRFGWLADDVGGDGVVGDPTGATAEHGERRFEASVAALVEALGEIRSLALPMTPDTAAGPSPTPAELEAHRRELEAGR